MSRRNPIRAHHGTAADFSEFDARKVVGRGSRAQYGWGVYLTNSEEVAAAYGRGAGGARVLLVRVAAEDEEFIDWDEPYTAQPSYVQRALRRLAEKRDKPGRILAGLFKDQDEGQTGEEGWAGRQFYSIAQDAFPGDRDAAKRVSLWMAKGGIAGTKFRDKTAAMDGTAINYCVFDLSKLRIEGSV